MATPTNSEAKIIKNQRGLAILISIFTFMFVAAISMELLEDTQVEYITSAQGVRKLKAYYTAKSGVEMSLLRILIYQKAVHLAGDALGSNASMLDQIWSFPFVWPPILPDQVSGADKEIIGSAVKESMIEGAISTQIVSEGSKIDINDLASPSENLAKNTRAQILRIFERKMEGEDAFVDLYQGFNFEELVNNITDWIDKDDEGRNGGSEKSVYRDRQSDAIPANQPIKTIDELHMIEGMTDDIFEVLAPQVTVHGVAGIQVNTAPKNVLMSIDPGIDEELADRIIKRRSNPDEGGPFPDLKTFLAFLESEGLTLGEESVEKEKIPLIFDRHINFRVVSTGTVGQTTREIVAIVYDFDRVKERVAKFVKEEKKDGDTQGDQNEERQKELEEECKDKEDDAKFECLCQDSKDNPDENNKCIEEKKKSAENEGDNQNADGNENQDKKSPPPSGRPNVVFWFEK